MNSNQVRNISIDDNHTPPELELCTRPKRKRARRQRSKNKPNKKRKRLVAGSLLITYNNFQINPKDIYDPLSKNLKNDYGKDLIIHCNKKHLNIQMINYCNIDEIKWKCMKFISTRKNSTIHHWDFYITKDGVKEVVIQNIGQNNNIESLTAFVTTANIDEPSRINDFKKMISQDCNKYGNIYYMKKGNDTMIFANNKDTQIAINIKVSNKEYLLKYNLKVRWES
jgi:hypothetical protein